MLYKKTSVVCCMQIILIFFFIDHASGCDFLCFCLYRKVAIIKSNKDIRYGLDSIVTHDGAKFPCWALPDLLSFSAKFGADEYEKV